MVVPKSLRDQIGLGPGPVEIVVDGTALRVEPVPGQGLEEREGRLVIPVSGLRFTDQDVRALRDADRR